MITGKSIPLRRLWGIFILVFSIGLLTTCSSNDEAETATVSQEFRTWLLVGPPGNSLPAGQAVNVRSRSEDAQYGISHVELYLVEFQPENSNDIIRDILIRSDAAPFQQTSFTVSQPFTPRQPGKYIIKVTGYNQRGEARESDTLSFDVK